MVSLDELPKKVQYVIVDSNMINGTNNNFSVDLTLKSNTHAEDINKVVGIRIVDFYISQSSNVSETDVSKYVDVICPEIPKRAQLLDENKGQIFARIPMEHSYTYNGQAYYQDDNHWRSFERPAHYFNPISIKKLSFEFYERRTNGSYLPLYLNGSFYMILEITTIDHKEKPKNREVQILQALNSLNAKIDELNRNVVRIPTQKEEEEKRNKKYPFAYLLLFISCFIGMYVTYVNMRRPQ